MQKLLKEEGGGGKEEDGDKEGDEEEEDEQNVRKVKEKNTIDQDADEKNKDNKIP